MLRVLCSRVVAVEIKRDRARIIRARWLSASHSYGFGILAMGKWYRHKLKPELGPFWQGDFKERSWADEVWN